MKITAMYVLLLCAFASATCQSGAAPQAGATRHSDDSRIDPRSPMNPAVVTLDPQTQGRTIAKNERTKLQLLTTAPSNPAPKLIPNTWPKFKLESIPTTWPDLQVTPITLK